MPTIEAAKLMADRLHATLASQGIDTQHAQSLELIAATLGYADWNTASSELEPDSVGHVRFDGAVPILRMFDEAKAREFYCGFLGFSVRMEHRLEPGSPLYMEVARAGLRLHLSEHHGDASPGSTVFVPMQGVRALCRELTDKDYRHARPAIETLPWGDVLEVPDPFGNRIRFCQHHA